MGPTMFSILAVTLGSTYIEWQCVTRMSWLHRLYVHGIGPVPGKMINFACSIMLSDLLAFVLGGGGGAAFIGGMTSTILVAMMISTKEKVNEAGVTWVGTKKRVSDHLSTSIVWWAENKHYFVDLAKTTMVMIKVVTWPLRACLKINSQVQEKRVIVAERIDEGRERLHAWRAS